MGTQKNVVLYTCVVNNRDRPKIIEYKDDFEYILFSDKNYKDTDWNVMPLVWSHVDPVRTARFHKHNPFKIFPHAEYVIWLDATHWPYKSLKILLKDFDISCMKHVLRNNITEEAEVCLKNQMDKEELIRGQLEFYKKSGFLDNMGLFSTSCVISKNTINSQKFHNLWWDEICSWSKRDQISLPYCLWKLPIKFEVIPGFCRLGPNDFFKMISHYKTNIHLC